MAVIAIAATSCKKEEITPNTKNEIENLKLVQTISNDVHTAEIYSTNTNFITGYNDVYVRVKEKNASEYLKNSAIEVKMMMNMMSMSHSCPVSSFSLVTGSEQLYKGFSIFQMASNDMENWVMTINFTKNGSNYQLEDTIQVQNASKRRVATFTGSDNARYVIALKEPSSPKIGTQTMHVLWYRMENSITFNEVTYGSIEHDPRMPSMGNHSSPNNTALTYQIGSKTFAGNLNLTMSGYWKLNLIAKTAEDIVLAGNEIDNSNTASSIFFEVEF